VSRKIDISQPLSDEDRAYLDTRGRHDLIALNDEQFGGSSDEEASLTSSQAEQANLQIEEEDDEYSDMTNEALREELSDRGLSTSGAKADLQARLRADDASQ
jgi:hypothetical protein